MKNYTTDAQITLYFPKMDLDTFNTIRGIINKMALDHKFNYNTDFQKVYEVDSEDDSASDNQLSQESLVEIKGVSETDYVNKTAVEGINGIYYKLVN